MMSTVAPTGILNCEKFKIALLLVRILVIAPICEIEAVPLATPVRCTAALAAGASAAAIGAMAPSSILILRARRPLRVLPFAGGGQGMGPSPKFASINALLRW